MKKEEWPLGWEVLKDEDKRVFFILGTAREDINVHNIAVMLNEKGHRISDPCPLISVFPTKEALIKYFKDNGYEYIEESWQTYYNIY